jgi:hypothetical protein
MGLQIGQGRLEKFGAVLKAPKSVVAVSAEQATDFSGCMTVVNVKASEDLGMVNAAYRALAILAVEDCFVAFDGNGIRMFEPASSFDASSTWCGTCLSILLFGPFGVSRPALLDRFSSAFIALRTKLKSAISRVWAKLLQGLHFKAYCARLLSIDYDLLFRQHGLHGTVATITGMAT